MTQEEFHKRYQYNPNTDCLGEGGFGKVYKAFDTHRDRYVAIKMAELKPHLEEVRLRKEVETISKLPSHPNIAYYEECYTFSTFAGEYDFGVLQYYELGNLEQLLRAKQLTNEQKDRILRQILKGIEFLHSQGIIHRDLKPQNILVVDRNGEYIPKITDFGISKKLDLNKSSVFTNSLAGAGTLSFASPEQLTGQAIRKNTDLWSFGVIACLMFTGKLPFNSGNHIISNEAERIELFKRIISGEVTTIIQQLPPEWCDLVKQCIVVDIDKRIRSVEICIEMIDVADRWTNEDSFEIVWERGYCGFLNLNGEMITPYKYDEVYNFRDGLACVKVGDKYGYINKKGIEIVPLIYDFAKSFSNGLAMVKKKRKYGYINKQGIETIPLKYFDAESFNEEFACVRLGNGKYILINRQDEEIISLKYKYVYGFSEGLLRVCNDNKFGFIDMSGNEIVALKYDDAYDFCEGMAWVELEYRSGFINKVGVEITPLNYDVKFYYDPWLFDVKEKYIFKEGLARVELDGKSGFINKLGKEIIPLKYDYAESFSEGLAVVKINKKYGFINKQGLVIIPLEFDSAKSFSEGLAGVKINDRAGFIDKENKIIIAFNYEYVGVFIKGIALVKRNGNYGYIDKLGNEFISCKYHYADIFHDGLAVVSNQEKKLGFINKVGVEVIPLIYCSALPFVNGSAEVILDNEEFEIDSKGNRV